MPEPVFMKLGMYIMGIEPISTAQFINPSHQPVFMYVYSRVSLLGNGSVGTFPWQRIYGTTEELLEVTFCIPSVFLSKENL
jgi:hypothetical protein